jgi:hypothetical protein
MQGTIYKKYHLLKWSNVKVASYPALSGWPLHLANPKPLVVTPWDLISSKSQFPARLGSTFGPTLNTCSRKTNNICLMLEYSPPSWFCMVRRQCRTHMAVGPGRCLGSPTDVVSVAAVPPNRDVAGSADCHDAPYQRRGASRGDRQCGTRSELWIEVIWFLWL